LKTAGLQIAAIFTGVGYLLSFTLGDGVPRQSFDQSGVIVWQPDGRTAVQATSANRILEYRILSIL